MQSFMIPMPVKDILKELIIIIFFSAVTAFTVNHFSPRGIAIFGEWDPSKGVVHARSKNNGVMHEMEIRDIGTAKSIYDTGEAVFVDARISDAYEDGHIQGSESLPLHRFDENIGQFFEKYPTNTFIITYCSSRDCDEAHRLAQYLQEVGYTNVRVFIDGFIQWKMRGYPVNR